MRYMLPHRLFYLFLVIWSIFLLESMAYVIQRRLFPVFSTSLRTRSIITTARIAATTDDTAKVDISSNEFLRLGLTEDIARALQAQAIIKPTSVQRATIPRLLSRENMVMAAATGSGKTLAYILPAIQHLMIEEKQEGYKRLPKRPRCLVLVPTRELALQVLREIKSISHYARVSSVMLVGGHGSYASQKASLAGLVDIVVASPGRLVQHKQLGHLYLSRVHTVIIDEVDTLLLQGFGADIRAILRGVKQLPGPAGGPGGEVGRGGEGLGGGREEVVKDNKPALHVVMATATLTKAVKRLLQEVEEVGGGGAMAAAAGGGGASTTAKGSFDIEFADPSNPTPPKSISYGIGAGGSGPRGGSPMTPSSSKLAVSIVEVAGLHQALPQIKHRFLALSPGQDKLEQLKQVLLLATAGTGRGGGGGGSLEQPPPPPPYRAMIFCNTVSSCRAVEHYLQEVYASSSSSSSSSCTVLCYHGDMKSDERSASLAAFREGQEGSTSLLLVCTDLAARGLDIPSLSEVVMFDFPRNSIDYLHRAGRVGRGLLLREEEGPIGGKKKAAIPIIQGKVTSLVAKRDFVLARAIETAIAKGLGLDGLSSDKVDYRAGGEHAALLDRPDRETVRQRLKVKALVERSNKRRGVAAVAAGKAGGPKRGGPPMVAGGGRRAARGGGIKPRSPRPFTPSPAPSSSAGEEGEVAGGGARGARASSSRSSPSSSYRPSSSGGAGGGGRGGGGARASGGGAGGGGRRGRTARGGGGRGGRR